MMLRRMIRNSLLACCLLSLLLAGTSQARVIDQLIAVIDGEPHTLLNLGAYAKSRMGREFPTGDLNQINQDDREVLEQFITDKLLEAEIRESGIKVTDEDVDAYVEQIKKKNSLSEEDLKTALVREGHTLASYRASVKSELEKGELINRQVKKKVNITNDDVERYYKLNSKNYREHDKVRLRHILLSLPETASPDEVAAVTAKANELRKRISAGEDFATLARQYSDGAGREDGGDIGWVDRGTLLKPIEEVAFNKLAVGEVGHAVRSSLGMHLVKVENRQTGAVRPLSVVGPKIREELYSKALEERFLKWLKTDLRRKHTVEVKISGVVFKPEDSKEGTVDSLMARSTRLNRRQERTFLSYLNPFSYIISETPIDEEDQKGPLAGKSIVSVFGIPLFTTDATDDIPDVLSAPADSSASSGSKGVDPSPEGGSAAKESGGFFSSIVDSINPFKK